MMIFAVGIRLSLLGTPGSEVVLCTGNDGGRRSDQKPVWFHQNQFHEGL